MKHIIAVISGKGGVGKSTVAVNLAVAFAQQGARVALIDSDFYGPSVPILMGGGEVKVDHEEKLIPPLKYGVKYSSIGFFLPNKDAAVIWRGPMFNKALTQMFKDHSWGEIDYCIVDMPPGTGDAQISLSQLVQVSGAVVVTTPQEVALADVRKAIDMLKRVNIPLLGIVENYSYLIESNGAKRYIFGRGGGAALATACGVPLLAEIPIFEEIRESGDLGEPIVLKEDSIAAKEFYNISLKLSEILGKSGVLVSSVEVVN
ncbi:MAG TPA: Mrp/NBP35 family ATP-binding protein [Oligoflexia bacterium]|nr:Mrp/NBP35 family ATP-binding protein [Oligoflexia bacterium]HMP26559.1 Mrp/NBP35 family ATP-binding protein [Oligoflexia bacterium]